MGGTTDAPCGRNQDGGLVDKAKETLSQEGLSQPTMAATKPQRATVKQGDTEPTTVIAIKKRYITKIAATDGRLNDGPTIRAVESVGNDDEGRTDCEFTSEGTTDEEAVADLYTTVGADAPELAEDETARSPTDAETEADPLLAGDPITKIEQTTL